MHNGIGMFTIQIFFNHAGRATLNISDGPAVNETVLKMEGPTALVLKTLDEFLRASVNA